MLDMNRILDYCVWQQHSNSLSCTFVAYAVLAEEENTDSDHDEKDRDAEVEAAV